MADGSLPCADHSRNYSILATGLGNYNSVNASAVLKLDQQHTVQVLATATSTISLTVAILALYWFCMMRRSFRRDLVLLLIIGGSWKSLWFMLFSVVTFARGPIQTTSIFCQISGYCLQLGFEACDFAVLFMSMHMYLQIFPPANSMLGHDGLYRVRHWVFGAYIVLPNLSAALAFVNPRSAFQAGGGFCSLPVRPIWYKLALFWIPRYLIWLYVMFVAVKIYRYVGSEFRVFGQARADSSSVEMPGQSSIDRAARADLEREQLKTQRSRMQSVVETEKPKDDGDEDGAPDDVSRASKVTIATPNPFEAAKYLSPNAGRRGSTPAWPTTFNPDASPHTSINLSNPASRRGSHQISPNVFAEDFALPPPIEGEHPESLSSLALEPATGLSVIQEGTPGSTGSNGPRDTAVRAINLRRRAIQRQLRLLFIYPVLYMILWTVPFVSNVMGYFNYWAQHPVFALRILQIWCLTVMTFGDVIIFCWRERPWHHIPGSDGTFFGSLMRWRYCFDSSWAEGRRRSKAMSLADDEEEHEKATANSQPGAGLSGSIKRLSSSFTRPTPRGSEASTTPTRAALVHKRNFSGGSDRKKLETYRAHERLALERAEYEMNRHSLQERRASVISQLEQTTPKRKEWFDREGELFEDQDQDEEKEKKTGEVV